DRDREPFRAIENDAPPRCRRGKHLVLQVRRASRTALVCWGKCYRADVRWKAVALLPFPWSSHAFQEPGRIETPLPLRFGRNASGSTECKEIGRRGCFGLLVRNREMEHAALGRELLMPALRH